MITQINKQHHLKRFSSLDNLTKPLILLFLLLTMQAICFAQGGTTPAATPPKKADSLSLQIKKLKDDALASQKTIDTLTKQLKAGNIVIPPSSKATFLAGTISIGAVCIFICVLLLIISLRSPTDVKFPFGLPDGSVRALIAILAILFYILASIVFAILSTSAIATDVTKTLGTLVVAVSAFYFGSKTAEQSNKATTETLTNIINKQTGNNG